MRGPKRKACAHPGCPNVHSNRGSFCDAHARPTTYQETDRKPANERGYDRQWRKARAAFLRDHPYCQCEDCRNSLNPRPADTVDHIVPHRGDATLFWDRNNWMPMNRRCHSRKTVEKDGGFGR